MKTTFFYATLSSFTSHNSVAFRLTLLCRKMVFCPTCNCCISQHKKLSSMFQTSFSKILAVADFLYWWKTLCRVLVAWPNHVNKFKVEMCWVTSWNIARNSAILFRRVLRITKAYWNYFSVWTQLSSLNRNNRLPSTVWLPLNTSNCNTTDKN